MGSLGRHAREARARQQRAVRDEGARHPAWRLRVGRRRTRRDRVVDKGTRLWRPSARAEHCEEPDRSAVGGCGAGDSRAWCIANGDTSQPPWEAAPDWARSSVVNGVYGVAKGNTPRESHESWLSEKAATGWEWGPTKDPEKKEHPCFVPYDELPPEQKAKDGIFVAVVRAVLEAAGEWPPK